jgi:hypothetical protein
MSSIIHEIATEFLENILETLKPHEGMKDEDVLEISKRLIAKNRKAYEVLAK